MRLPCQKIIDKLNKHPQKLFLVGGVVRDLLLGEEVSDIDIVVEGNAIEFCKTLEGDILSTHIEFGTVKMLIDDVEIDFASTREEDYPKSGCLPVVKNLGCELKKDVLRRDFTLNSIAIDLKTGEIIDYLNGIKDLNAKKLKLTYSYSFYYDPTRILRALDFSLRFNFSLPQKQINEFLSNPPTRESLSISRVDLTLKKILKNPLAYKQIVDMKLYKIFQDDAPKIEFEKLQAAILFFGANPTDVYFRALKNDILNIEKYTSDYEIYKAYKNFSKEDLALMDNIQARKFYNELKDVKIKTDGDDIIKLGIKEGKIIGYLLEELLKEKLNNPKNLLKNKMDEKNFVLNLHKNIKNNPIFAKI